MPMEILHNGGGNPIGADEVIVKHLPDADKDVDEDSSQWWR